LFSGLSIAGRSALPDRIGPAQPKHQRSRSMEFDAVLLAPRRAASIAAGHWHDRTIND
jgi:hypothetical protein